MASGDHVFPSAPPPRRPAGDLERVEVHQARVAALIEPTPVIRLPLAECLGLALAEDLHTAVDLPPFDNSAMDGYAVRSTDVASASAAQPVTLPVVADIPAGRNDIPELRPGTAHRIMTGAPMPAGADAVVKVELTDGGTEMVRIDAGVAAGTYLRRAGEDVPAGERVLAGGVELGPAQLGLAAAASAAELRVHRRPRVLVLSTGSELVAAGDRLAPGQIYDSNGVMLASAVRQAGAIADQSRFVPDDVATFRTALAARLSGVDLVLTSGGVSAGAYEVVKDALEGQGVEFVKVAMQPGGPQGAGRFAGTPVVALPGNPVSALVSFEVFVRPMLRRAMGYAVVSRPVLPARLVEAVPATPGRRQFRRGHYDAATGRVRLVGGRGSHLLSALSKANCLVIVPENTSDLRPDAKTDVLLLST